MVYQRPMGFDPRPFRGEAWNICMGNAFHSDDPLSSQVIDQWRQRIRLTTAANYHYHMGLALADSGATEAAIANFRKSVELTPDHLGARYDLEQLLSAQGQPPAERLDPAQWLRGLIQHLASLLEAGKATRARQVLADISGPASDEKVLAWARVLIDLLCDGARQSRPHPAAPLDRQQLEILYPLRGAFRQAGQLCLQWANPDGIDYFDLYCALEPEDQTVLINRALALVVARRLDEVRSLLGTLPRDGAVATRQCAILNISLDDGAAALAELGRLTEDPVHGMTAALHTAALLLLGRAEEAARHLQYAEQALPGNPWVQVVRAWYDRQAGQPPAARLDGNAVGIRGVLSRLPTRIAASLGTD